MECSKTEKGIKFCGVSELDLQQTLDCGQSFRWEKTDDGYKGVAFKKSVTMRLDGTTLYIDNAKIEDGKLWHSYLDFDLDYKKIREEIANIHPVLKDACEYAGGIRILRQEPWEVLCTFIISQNNNIKRIKGIVARLCESFGDKLDDGSFSFPDAGTLAVLSPEKLTPLRAGFRAKYIIDAAVKVANGEVDLENCRDMPYEQARLELMKIKGVGVKVADCTLLFGMHRVEAFPVDVWMKRAMQKLFVGMTADDFGSYAGIAQQYIFHYSRMHPQLFE